MPAQIAIRTADDRASEAPSRGNVRDHIAFGRGPHACPGAPLARIEAKVGIERLFDHFEHIALDPDRYGAQPRYEYLRSYILRGLSELHLRLT